MPDNPDLVSRPAARSRQPAYYTNIPDGPARTSTKPVAPPPETRTAYDRAVETLEARYPQLNPDSPSFDIVATRAVVERMQAYVQQGKSADVAIRIAAEDVMATPKAMPTLSNGPTAQPRQPARGVDAIKEKAAKGAAVGAVLGGLGFAAFFIRWLLRKSRAAALRAAQVVGTIAASDAARSASGVASSVAQKSGEVLDGLGRSLPSAKRSDKLPWQ